MPTSASSSFSRKSIACGCFLAVFGLAWTAGVGFFDVVEFDGICHQLLALRYNTAPGRIILSELKESRADRGRKVYSPNIHYTYEVDGTPYQGDRYRYGQMATGDKSYEKIIAEFPVGAAVTIYYRSSDPKDSLLQPGVMGSDLFILLFLLPFNVVLLGIWWAFAFQFGLRRKRTAGGAKIVDDGFRVRVRLAVFTPMMAAAATICALSFIAIFALRFTVSTNPPLNIMIGVWCGLLGAGLLAGIKRAMRLASGDSDLAIDNMEKNVRLPRGMGRKEPMTVPIANITGLDVETVVRTGAKGESSNVYVPTIFYSTTEGSKFKLPLAEWYDELRARELASWIGERLQELGWQQR
jgi:hypothetical protein